MDDQRKAQHRDFLKDHIRMQVDFRKTDQSRGVPPPPVQKPFEEDAGRIRLVAPEAFHEIGAIDLTDAIRCRQSHRRFTGAPLTLAEISYLLWATQGIRRVSGPGHALRTVPSAGCRHAFETYACVLNVEGLETGIYRYLAVEHELLPVRSEPELSRKLIEGSLGQKMCGRGAVTFLWTAIPYRMEWRYDLAAHRVILIDAGHLCQNLYLAVQAVGAGTCAVAAFRQEKMDELLGVDGEEEFTVYLAAVGKLT